MTRSALATLGALILLAGCAPAASTAESNDRAECKEYARSFEHSGRMKDACLISRGYTVSYAGRLQFTRCMTPRGYGVRSGD